MDEVLWQPFTSLDYTIYSLSLSGSGSLSATQNSTIKFLFNAFEIDTDVEKLGLKVQANATLDGEVDGLLIMTSQNQFSVNGHLGDGA